MTDIYFKPKNIDEYIIQFPIEVQDRLQVVRKTIKQMAPDATEVISYSMPAFKQKNILVYFAGYKQHIGFYPGASGIENFKEEISKYKWAKGSVQFPHDEPLPLDLISRIVEFRLNEILENKKIKTITSKK